MTPSFLQIAFVLGLLSAIGPFAIDMYLPALPTIGQSLGASVGAVQASLSAFFLALGAGQIIYGPASDMLGRKRPMVFGLLVFVGASVGCALAPDVQTLVVLRFVQGLGACACTVVPRAVVRDLHTGAEAARLTSLLMLVFSVSPILAPLAGSFLIEQQGWRAVFWAVTGIGLLGLAVLAFGIQETRPREARLENSLGSALRGYGVLLRDRHFLALVGVGAFGTASFFTYLANSSFVMIDHYGLTPRQYSMAFAVNAASFIGISQFNGALAKRFGLARVVKVGVTGYALVMLALLALNLLVVDQLAVLIVMLLAGYGFLGLVAPTTAVLALEEHGALAGTASALMGTLQIMAGAAVVAVAAHTMDGTARPMIAAIAACACAAFVLAWLALGARGQAKATR